MNKKPPLTFSLFHFVPLGIIDPDTPPVMLEFLGQGDPPQSLKFNMMADDMRMLSSCNITSSYMDFPPKTRLCRSIAIPRVCMILCFNCLT